MTSFEVTHRLSVISYWLHWLILFLVEETSRRGGAWEPPWIALMLFASLLGKCGFYFVWICLTVTTEINVFISFLFYLRGEVPPMLEFYKVELAHLPTQKTYSRPISKVALYQVYFLSCLIIWVRENLVTALLFLI